MVVALCGLTTAASAQDVIQGQNYAGRVYAKRFAMGKKLADGTFVYTTPWMDIVREGSGQDTEWNSAFDAYEGDENLATYPPIGFLDCGDNGSLFAGAAPSSRWWFGATFYAPGNIDDMTVAPGFAGTDAGRISGAWNWSTTLQQAVLLITIYEDFGDCVLPAGSNPVGDSLVLDFGFQTGGQGYFSFDEELVAGTPPVPFTIGLPADGTGAYEQQLLNAIPVTGQPLSFAQGPGVQNMYWGTDDHVPNPSGRAGTSGPNNWRDNTVPHGEYAVTECIAPVPPVGGCPTQLQTMIQFWVKGGGSPCPACACNIDTSTGQNVCDIFDFLTFGNLFSSASPCACDLDVSTGQGVCDIFDFLTFGNLFSAGC